MWLPFALLFYMSFAPKVKDFGKFFWSSLHTMKTALPIVKKVRSMLLPEKAKKEKKGNSRLEEIHEYNQVPQARFFYRGSFH